MAAWITDMLETQLPSRFPWIKGFVWMDGVDGTDWRIATSTSAKSAFAHGIALSNYAANVSGSLGGTNVQPLS